MNYIKTLQVENKALNSKLNQIENSIDDFTIFLNSPKFTGTQSDGSRKDWISTTDVMNRLKELRSLTLPD